MRAFGTTIVLAFFVAFQAFAGPIVWPGGRQAAIVLTYDDGTPSQLEIAVPQLNAARLKGTFFLNAKDLTPAGMLRWQTVLRHGHELGNHTVNHPCPRAILPQTAYATEDYTPAKMLSEIGVMNDVLFGIDGKSLRTMAYPCSQTNTGGGDYLEGLRQSGLIRYARTGGDPYNSVITDLAKLDFFMVPSNGPVNHPDGAELIAYVKRVQAAGGLGVLQFHGVGGDYLEVSAEAHQQLVDYLKANPTIWVTTFQSAMDYVKTQKK